jgi:hypothetical protein
MFGLWSVVQDESIVKALLAIQNGLEEGDRTAISVGFERLNRATASFWTWGTEGLLWGSRAVAAAEIPLVLMNPVTGDWLRLSPATGTVEGAKAAVEHHVTESASITN